MKTIVCSLVILMMLAQCRERYDLPLTIPSGYLVVEGFIVNNGITTVRLSRTNKLDDRNIVPVKGAIVQVIGEDNSTYPLAEGDSGLYVSNELSLNNSVRYKVDIRTPENKEYASAFEPVLTTPPIDSISWLYDEKGLSIYVNAHDHDNTRYYKWDYDETYEFESAYHSNLIFEVTPTAGPEPIVNIAFYSPRYQSPNDSIFTCWKTQASSTVQIGTTTKLAQDVVYIPIIFYPRGSKELSKLYSVNLRQYSISKEAYIFFEKLKKNTESLGGLFDAQPSQIIGNVTGVTDPSEQVIGYVDVTSMTIKRKFISNSELPDWNYSSSCKLSAVFNNPDALLSAWLDQLYPVNILAISRAGTIISINASPTPCVDCTVLGTNRKPDFWP